MQLYTLPPLTGIEDFFCFLKLYVSDTVKMATIFNLLAMQVLCFVIGIAKRINPQLRICVYLLNELIHHSVIFVFEDFAGGLMIILFVVF